MLLMIQYRGQDFDAKLGAPSRFRVRAPRALVLALPKNIETRFISASSMDKPLATRIHSIWESGLESGVGPGSLHIPWHLLAKLILPLWTGASMVIINCGK